MRNKLFHEFKQQTMIKKNHKTLRSKSQIQINVQIEIQILNFYKFDSIENLPASFSSLPVH